MEHTLGPGKAVLEGLKLLGLSLGYEVRQEHNVGKSAAVDLSWTAAKFNDVPLFVFEVESTPSAGLANNATKIFGSPLEELTKPLFFFHLVLAGTPDNERIRNARQVWGQHNYRIYRFNSHDDRLKLVLDILDQHRRVIQEISPASVVDALRNAGWDAHSLIFEVLSRMEDRRFFAAYLHDFGSLALEDDQLLPLFIRRLRRLDSLDPMLGRAEREIATRVQESEKGYLNAPGDYIPGLLENALRINQRDVADSGGPALFERWANSSNLGFRMIDGAFGLDRDYDNFVLFTAPFQYVWAANALTGNPESYAWVLNDLMTLVEREHKRGISGPAAWPGIIWMSHLLARKPIYDIAFDVESKYRRLQEIVKDNGGIPLDLLICPPQPWAPEDTEDRWQWLENRTTLPSIECMRQTVADRLFTDDESPRDNIVTPWRTCLSALVSHAPYMQKPSNLVRDTYLGT